MAKFLAGAEPLRRRAGVLLKRTLKLLHELGTVGVMGAMAAQLVLASASADMGMGDLAVVRQVMLAVAQWLLLPSLGLVLVSGAFAIAAHKPFLSAEWALVKAIMTPLILEGTFMMVMRPAKGAAKLTAKMAGGAAPEDAAAKLETLLQHEQWGLWVMLVLFLAQIVLAIWRPRLRPRRAPEPGEGEASSAPEEAEPA